MRKVFFSVTDVRRWRQKDTLRERLHLAGISFSSSVMYVCSSGQGGSYEALDGGVMAPGGHEKAFGEGPRYIVGPPEAPRSSPPSGLEPPQECWPIKRRESSFSLFLFVFHSRTTLVKFPFR